MKKKMAAGGEASSYNDMTAGSGSGLGRLQKTSIASKTVSQKLKKGGKVLGYASGGKMSEKAWEGSAEDLRQDKKLAKKHGMSFTDWEKSSADTKHDKQQNMKGLKKGGKAKMADGGMSGDDAMADYIYRQKMRETAPVPRPRPQMQDSANMPVGLRAKRKEGEMEFLDKKLQNAYDLQDKANAREVPLNALQVLSAFPKDAAGRDFYNSQNRRDKNMGYDLEDRVLEAQGRVARGGPGGMKKGGHVKGCDCMSCGGKAKKMAKGGKADGFAPMAPIMKSARSKGIAPFRATTPQLGMADNSRGPTDIPKYAKGGMSTAMDGMKKPLRPLASGMAKLAKGGMAEGSPAEERMDKRQAKKAKMSMADFEKSGKDVEKMAKGGVVGKTFGKPLPGTKVSSKVIRSTTATGASMKKDGMKGAIRAKASGAKPTNMMKPLGMTKMASGGKVRGTGIAQRGTKFIGEV